MTVEAELEALSLPALKKMNDGLDIEMSRLSMSSELQKERDDPNTHIHATWKAMSIMSRAVQAEIASRLFAKQPTKH